MIILSFLQFINEDNFPIKIKQHIGNPHAFSAYYKGKRVGSAIYWKDLNHGNLSIYKSKTHPDFRKKGIMTQLYKHIENTLGKELYPSSTLSDDGFEFWKRFRPESVKNDLRHYKDNLIGKEVTHTIHGPAIIDTVSSGGVVARKTNGNTFFLSKNKLKEIGLLNDNIN